MVLDNKEKDACAEAHGYVDLRRVPGVATARFFGNAELTGADGPTLVSVFYSDAELGGSMSLMRSDPSLVSSIQLSPHCHSSRATGTYFQHWASTGLRHPSEIDVNDQYCFQQILRSNDLAVGKTDMHEAKPRLLCSLRPQDRCSLW